MFRNLEMVALDPIDGEQGYGSQPAAQLWKDLGLDSGLGTEHYIKTLL